MKFLVTGGAGFIGSNLIDYLLNEAEADFGIKVEAVINIDALTYAGNPANLSDSETDERYFFVHGDICDRELMRRILHEHEPSFLLHLAAESHVDRSIEDSDAFIQTNVVGTHSLLEEARLYHKEKKRDFRFTHVSTDEVFGSLQSGEAKFHEDTPYQPNSPYAASKAASDFLARAYFHTHALPLIITNCSNNYGPRQFPEKLIPLALSKLLAGEAIPIYGQGKNVRDWLFVEDHARGIVAASLRGTVGESYCFGADNEISNIDIARKLVECLRDLASEHYDGDESNSIVYVKDRPGHDFRYAIDARKAKKELAWRPRYAFDKALKKTISWYLDNQKWVNDILSGEYRGERLGL